MGENNVLYMPIKNLRRKYRRNEPCPHCASGRKFKFCCGSPLRQPGSDLPRLIRTAGKPHEKPIAFVGAVPKPLGPIPAQREILR